MKYFRVERISRLIREELNKMILRHIEIPGALVTVTDVELSKNRTYATIKFNALPPEKSEEALKILNKSRGKLQHLLLKSLHIKPTPQISFKIDYGSENIIRVEKALRGSNN